MSESGLSPVSESQSSASLHLYILLKEHPHAAAVPKGTCLLNGRSLRQTTERQYGSREPARLVVTRILVPTCIALSSDDSVFPR